MQSSSSPLPRFSRAGRPHVPKEVYDLFGEMLAEWRSSVFFCVFLQIKGHVAPTDEDSGRAATPSTTSGGAWSCTCSARSRQAVHQLPFGMMRQGFCPSFPCYQHERDGRLADSVAVTTLLMSVYNFKFFLWETGYFNSMDIQHDRAALHLLGMFRVGARGVRVAGAVRGVGVAPTRSARRAPSRSPRSVCCPYQLRQRPATPGVPRQQRQEEGLGQAVADDRGEYKVPKNDAGDGGRSCSRRGGGESPGTSTTSPR